MGGREEGMDLGGKLVMNIIKIHCMKLVKDEYNCFKNRKSHHHCMVDNDDNKNMAGQAFTVLEQQPEASSGGGDAPARGYV